MLHLEFKCVPLKYSKIITAGLLLLCGIKDAFFSPRLQQKHANESNEPNLVISGCAANAKVNNASVFLSIVGAEKNRNTENRGVEIRISCKWSFADRSSDAYSLHRFIAAERQTSQVR